MSTTDDMAASFRSVRADMEPSDELRAKDDKIARLEKEVRESNNKIRLLEKTMKTQRLFRTDMYRRDLVYDFNIGFIRSDPALHPAAELFVANSAIDPEPRWLSSHMSFASVDFHPNGHFEDAAHMFKEDPTLVWAEVVIHIRHQCSEMGLYYLYESVQTLLPEEAKTLSFDKLLVAARAIEAVVRGARALRVVWLNEAQVMQSWLQKVADHPEKPTFAISLYREWFERIVGDEAKCLFHLLECFYPGGFSISIVPEKREDKMGHDPEDPYDRNIWHLRREPTLYMIDSDTETITVYDVSEVFYNSSKTQLEFMVPRRSGYNLTWYQPPFRLPSCREFLAEKYPGAPLSETATE